MDRILTDEEIKKRLLTPEELKGFSRKRIPTPEDYSWQELAYREGQLAFDIVKAQDAKTAKIVREETLREVGGWLDKWLLRERAIRIQLKDAGAILEVIAKLKQGVLK